MAARREYPVRVTGRRVHLAVAVLLLAASLVGAAQPTDLAIEGPPALQSTMRQVREIDWRQLVEALDRAGLELPARVQITVIPDDDPRARETPDWMVGRAYGDERIELFPARVGSYPYDSLESVVRHEVVHLALTARAGGRPLPRWFHEGVATSVESGWSAAGELRLLLAALERPGIADVGRLFASDARPTTAQAYLLAAALMDDVRERHGQAVPGAIARRVASGASFDLAFELETGRTVEQAAAHAWAGYRRLSRWIPVLTSPSAVWLLILGLAVVAFAFQWRRRRAQRRRWDEEEAMGEPDV